jgi:hypothetical protein
MDNTLSRHSNTHTQGGSRSRHRPTHKDGEAKVKKRNLFEKKDRGAFTISIFHGKFKRRFADAFYFAQAHQAMAVRKFATPLEFATFFQGLPNGFNTFEELTLPTKIVMRKA